MKWRVYLSSVLVVFLSLCFGSFIINQKNNVSALSDLTYTSTYNGSSFPSIGNFCDTGNHTPVDCTGYKYLIIESSTLTNSYAFSSDGFARQTPMGYTTFSIIEIPSSWTRIGFYGISISDKDSSDYIKFTLSETYQSGAPSGSITLTQNGTYDVTNYAEAVVNVPAEVVQGDYHDDLVSINNSILIVCAVGLVIYFFYAIYKMLLGGKTL